MKKVMLVIAIGVMVASCSKSTTCECDVITSDGVTPVQHSVINLSQSKRQAKKGTCATYSEKVNNVPVQHNCKVY